MPLAKTFDACLVTLQSMVPSADFTWEEPSQNECGFSRTQDEALHSELTQAIYKLTQAINKLTQAINKLTKPLYKLIVATLWAHPKAIYDLW